MKNYAALTNQCIANLEKINIKCGKVAEVKINSRAKRCWGFCKRQPNGTFIIELAACLIADDVPDNVILDTIYHELLHTVPGCFNHGDKWKNCAHAVNRAYGTNVKRTASTSEYGVEISKSYKYVFRCQKCGGEIKRYRMSQFVRYYNLYNCGCGGEFKKVL